MGTWFRFLAAAVLIMPALADSVTVSVYPSLAPNIYGSPSWSQYLANAMAALESGTAATGNPVSDPAAYDRVTAIQANDNVVTNFPAWLGQADPTGIFASELGNRLHFGVVIQGNGTQFSLSDLSFSMSSSDPSDIFGWDDGFNASDSYSSTRVGYRADTGFITSGSADQLVDAFYYVGVGLAPPVNGSDPGLTDQDKINNVLAGGQIYDCGFPCGMPTAPYAITTTYSIEDVTGAVTSGSASVYVDTAIPEPAAVLLLSTLLAATALALRRAHRGRILRPHS